MQPTYYYHLYDKTGKYLVTVTGVNVECIYHWLERRGWTGINCGGIAQQLKSKIVLTTGQRAGAVYGRDRRAESRSKKKTKTPAKCYNHVAYIREKADSTVSTPAQYREDLSNWY